MIKILSSLNYIGLNNWEEMKPTTAEASSSAGTTTQSAISLKKAKSRTKNPRKRPVSGLSSSSTNASASDASPDGPNTGRCSSVEPTTTAQTTSREERVPQSSTSHHNHKNFPAFPARTVQTIYEQWDKDAEPTELHAEVFPRLAEDLSYRMWEIVNVMKSFARHSGGRLTCDIVNEVFKECQVPAAYGAHDGNNDWIEIEEEKSPFHFLVPGGESAEKDCFYVNSDTDKILNIGEEYMKASEFALPSVDLQLSGTWQVDKKHIDVLLEFVENLVNGALLGNKECMTYTLQITYSAPFIGPVFKAILKELLKVLAFNQTELVVRRGLTFLKCLAQNEHIRDVIGDCRSEFFNLAELFVNFLIGAGDALMFGHPLRSREKAMEILKVVAKEKGFSVDSMPSMQKALEDPDIKKKCDVAFEYCNYIEYRQLLEADRLIDNRKYKRLKENEEKRAKGQLPDCDDDIDDSSLENAVGVDIPEEERIEGWAGVIESAEGELAKEFNALFNSGNYSKKPPQPPDDKNGVHIKEEPKPETCEEDEEEERDQMILLSLVEDEIRKIKQQESLQKTYTSGDIINRRTFDDLNPLKNDFYVEPDPHSEDELEESMAYDYKKLNDSFSSSNSNKCSLFRGAVLNLESAFLLCETMGHLGAQFTYFQTECLQGILQRLDIFFRLNNANNNNNTTNTNHFKRYFDYYEFLVRAINGLICLGEYAFREFLPYCHMVEYKHFPEVFLSFVSQAAMFLKGQDDYFFYEWLEDVCGDRIQPFMLYKYKYHQYLTTKCYKLQKPPTFKIMPKVRFKILPRIGEEDENKKLNNSISFREILLQPFNIDFHLVPNIKMEVDEIDYGVGGGDQDKSKSSSLATNHNHHHSKTNLKKIFFPNYSPVINRPLKFHFKFSGCRPTAERNRNSSMSTNMNSNSNFGRSGGLNVGVGSSSSSSSGIANNNNSSSGGNNHIFHNNFNNNTSCNINHYGSNINNNNNNNCNNVNDNFKRKIVVARGRLLKPLSDRKKFVNLSNYCFVQI